MSEDKLQKTVNEQAAEHEAQLDAADVVDASDVVPLADAGEAKRAELRDRIAAAEQRNEQRSFGDYAKEAADGVTSFAKEHPIATVAGAVAIGVAIGAMTRPGRRLARRGGAMAALAREAVLAYGLSMIDDIGDLALHGKDRAEDFADTASTRARGFGRRARTGASNLAEDAGLLGRRASRSTSRSIRDLRRKVTHR